MSRALARRAAALCAALAGAGCGAKTAPAAAPIPAPDEAIAAPEAVPPVRPSDGPAVVAVANPADPTAAFAAALSDRQLTAYARIKDQLDTGQLRSDQMAPLLSAQGLTLDDAVNLTALTAAFYGQRALFAEAAARLAARRRPFGKGRTGAEDGNDIAKRMGLNADPSVLRARFVARYGAHAAALLDAHWPEYERFYQPSPKPSGAAAGSKDPARRRPLPAP